MGSITEPVRVHSDRKFRDVAVGEYHACGIDDTGSVYCWGDPKYGKIWPPDGPDTRYQEPGEVTITSNRDDPRTARHWSVQVRSTSGPEEAHGRVKAVSIVGRTYGPVSVDKPATVKFPVSLAGTGYYNVAVPPYLPAGARISGHRYLELLADRDSVARRPFEFSLGLPGEEVESANGGTFTLPDTWAEIAERAWFEQLFLQRALDADGGEGKESVLRFIRRQTEISDVLLHYSVPPILVITIEDRKRDLWMRLTGRLGEFEGVSLGEGCQDGSPGVICRLTAVIGEE